VEELALNANGGQLVMLDNDVINKTSPSMYDQKASGSRQYWIFKSQTSLCIAQYSTAIYGDSGSDTIVIGAADLPVVVTQTLRGNSAVIQHSVTGVSPTSDFYNLAVCALQPDPISGCLLLAEKRR
jgi:hypothetical protein